MSNRLPALKGREVVKALKRAGFEERHGTLFSIIHQSGLSIEDFKELI